MWQLCFDDKVIEEINFPELELLEQDFFFLPDTRKLEKLSFGMKFLNMKLLFYELQLKLINFIAYLSFFNFF